MNQETPRTLLKVGNYGNSLEDAVKRFSVKLEYISFGLGNTVKYARFEEDIEPYLLIVSQQKHKLLTPPGYNVILTITSYSDIRNQEVAKKFSDQTGIPLDLEVPDILKTSLRLEIMNRAFEAFEKNPKEAMSILK
jgi:hypothetical protein